MATFAQKLPQENTLTKDIDPASILAIFSCFVRHLTAHKEQDKLRVRVETFGFEIHRDLKITNYTFVLNV